jgi:hypothetical protein
VQQIPLHLPHFLFLSHLPGPVASLP